MYTRRAITLLLLPALFGAQHASAQGLVYQLGDEATIGGNFGLAVGDAGDVDADGYPDIIVGSPIDHTAGNSAGAVHLYSGLTGDLIWFRLGENAQDRFGWSVDGIGDVNGDGHSDVIVGAPHWDNGGAWSDRSGKVYVLSGATGAVMSGVTINAADAVLGHMVRGLGDIDGDGIGDYGFSAPGRDWNGMTGNGYVAVYSGSGNQFLFSTSGSADGAYHGYSFDVIYASGSQVTSRIIVGEPLWAGSTFSKGRVRIFDGFGGLAHTIDGVSTGASAGWAVAGIGDANGDGVQDYAYSAPKIDILFVGADAGRVYAVSGSNNAPLFSPTGSGPGTYFGTALSGLGDFNGDGRDDFLIGSEHETLHGLGAGEARVVSGANGGTLASWHGGEFTSSGASVSAAGDLNHDGRIDAVFGAPWSIPNIGSAQVRLAALGENVVYCVATVNSQGCTPQIDVTGAASRTIANSLHVTASQVLNNQYGMLFYGFAQDNAPFQGGTLCVQTPLRRTDIQHSGGNAGPSDCSGTYDFHFSHAFMSSENIAPGLSVHAQYWSRDPFSPNTGLTNAVRFDVVP